MYTIWFQVYNRDGSINNEDITATAETLNEAVKKAHDGDVIRYIEGYKAGDDFWEVYDKVGGYEEYDHMGNEK